MKKIFTIILLTLLISCSNDDNGNQTENAVTEYHQFFFDDSKIIISPAEKPEKLDLDVVNGDKLVFKFLKFVDIYPKSIDDEQTTIIYFEVDPKATEFKIENENFIDANAIIGLGASVRIFDQITEGSIEGVKISENEWKVNLNIPSIYEEIKLEDGMSNSNIFSKSVFDGIWMPIFTN